jgi:2-iminobutanoate/2-iminopropanoate deaminase
MDIKVLVAKDAFRFDLPFSPGIKYGALIFTSGQVPYDNQGNLVGKGDIKKQTEQTLLNIEAVLKAGGATLNDVLKVNIFMRDPSQFSEMNEVYKKFFKGRFPARTTVQSNLTVEGMLIEIEAVARVPE